jgi:transcriptional regulator with XRE-family HTH domain
MDNDKNVNINIKIALVIKDLREANKITQETVYNETGIHIGRIEKNKQDLRISTIEKLADYFQIPLVEFFKQVANK